MCVQVAGMTLLSFAWGRKEGSDGRTNSHWNQRIRMRAYLGICLIRNGNPISQLCTHRRSLPAKHVCSAPLFPSGLSGSVALVSGAFEDPSEWQSLLSHYLQKQGLCPGPQPRPAVRSSQCCPRVPGRATAFSTVLLLNPQTPHVSFPPPTVAGTLETSGNGACAYGTP